MNTHIFRVIMLDPNHRTYERNEQLTADQASHIELLQRAHKDKLVTFNFGLGPEVVVHLERI